MSKVKVAINGYGTIGKRVADAVSLQDDMEVVGVSKTRPNFEARFAKKRKYPLYAPNERIEAFEKAGLEVEGDVRAMCEAADVVVDCTPGGVGEQYKDMYIDAGCKAIWQGGEKHDIAGFSFNALSNYSHAIGRDAVRVVSCNTTALCRLLYLLDGAYGIKKTRVVLMRRGTDPGDAKKGPINAIVPNPITLPSHHGPDVNTVIPHIPITTLAAKLSTTLMHMHAVNVELESSPSREEVAELLSSEPRMLLIGSDVGSTAEVIEMARDAGRPRNDVWENVIWEDSITVENGELYLFQGVHQESIVIPENIDAIRAMCELERDAAASMKKTNGAMGIGVL
ncbi:type II glyceraldehyde-3-phosphate dehydrogenase [Methermicoccus shengliensis]|uniref:Glyceraldehyde-3-phosphate dehydrogenase n=1 Tax=Methermicoccus shengliensis TaxID=660064 RepID=A0A832RWC3_9EURY|nr:type II glyceraldehyde-3-phosphate dehydrogenase [Methermicoccus shengliensis]KUK04855.1 MAG: Glyceraldehyde-3-phosphate dehydrogenase [Euryarchaeota archaeon 55_53]KUK30483.1 MAG: Glyceraldehyde-3-phosphate dehydrogenase [Methanosarcinales archeaon 56_1174]MDI3487895.1 glyceraldehyde-3-phosphate dehydrogenase [Methanosarcinales archaeon]MDN5295363.1 glyceraldehyde-3-phosphate dehydrogenase [Methanosarcinales archaeon]HIH69551.1 type II glyceraldehyde-3-phosphate dehydrogenase [Methermicocc